MSIIWGIKKHSLKLLVFAINIGAVVVGVNALKNQDDQKNLAVNTKATEAVSDQEIGSAEVADASVDTTQLDAIQAAIEAERQAKLDTLSANTGTVTETKQIAKQVPETITQKVPVKKSSSKDSSDNDSSSEKKTASKPKPKPKPKPEPKPETTTETKTS